MCSHSFVLFCFFLVNKWCSFVEEAIHQKSKVLSQTVVLRRWCASERSVMAVRQPSWGSPLLNMQVTGRCGVGSGVCVPSVSCARYMGLVEAPSKVTCSGVAHVPSVGLVFKSFGLQALFGFLAGKASRLGSPSCASPPASCSCAALIPCLCIWAGVRSW